MADTGDQTSQRSSAPDLEILGDQVTLRPSGYIEPSEQQDDDDKDRALMGRNARFRKSPLEYALFPPESS
jgi:hypothetical protein